MDFWEKPYVSAQRFQPIADHTVLPDAPASASGLCASARTRRHRWNSRRLHMKTR